MPVAWTAGNCATKRKFLNGMGKVLSQHRKLSMNLFPTNDLYIFRILKEYKKLNYLEISVRAWY